MIPDYTIITIKVDSFRLSDIDKVNQLARLHSVPSRASVRIVTNGSGTTVTFEWSNMEPKKVQVQRPGALSKDEWRYYYKN